MWPSAPVVMLLTASSDERDLYCEILSRADYSVIACTSIAGGKANAADADLVITGVGVEARNDGIGFIEWLRAQPTTRNTPVLVLTAYVSPDDGRQAFDAGCDRFMGKPCLPRELQWAVRELLARGGSRNREKGL